MAKSDGIMLGINNRCGWRQSPATMFGLTTVLLISLLVILVLPNSTNNNIAFVEALHPQIPTSYPIALYWAEFVPIPDFDEYGHEHGDGEVAVRKLRESTGTPFDKNKLKDRIFGAFFGSLIADALCLQSHYHYVSEDIRKGYGGKMPVEYKDPGEGLYARRQHSTKHWGRRVFHKDVEKGDQTDNGIL